MRRLVRKTFRLIKIATIAFVLLIVCILVFGMQTSAKNTRATEEDMQVLGRYMDMSVNEQVSENLGGSATPTEWLEEYVSIDPDFDTIIEENTGLSFK